HSSEKISENPRGIRRYRQNLENKRVGGTFRHCQDYLLDKSMSVPYDCSYEVNYLLRFGLPARVACNSLRRSLFIEAISFRVGTVSKNDFCFFLRGSVMTLSDINEMFATDDKCRELLKRLRWPQGVKCTRCGDEAVKLATGKELFYCRKCDYQFSVTAGTIFNDSHLPLTKWFIATLLICEARKGFSANQMKRTLGVSYKTAWYLCHRIRAAMVEASKPKLTGTVEVDETYVGGKKRGEL